MPGAIAKAARKHRLSDVVIAVPPGPDAERGLGTPIGIEPAVAAEAIVSGLLLEWAVVHGIHRYGTPRAPVLAALAQCRPAILEIDLQGARQVRTSWPEAQFVFLAPPSWEELVRRLVGRGTETAEQRERRLETARAELASQAEFDHVVVNREVGQAVQELVELSRL